MDKLNILTYKNATLHTLEIVINGMDGVKCGTLCKDKIARLKSGGSS